ncbi:MAG: DUF4423 domain-containing protein [Bacteriovoracaceae bacterium]|nr:DUF4423 domain-containing protein [Bacteriovoracaceae bacterium]
MKQQDFCYYVKKMNLVLSQRQSLNVNYSLRAFGRDLGIHPSSLSQILLGKRKIPKKKLHHTIENLALSPEEQEKFKISHQESLPFQNDEEKIESKTLGNFFIDDSEYRIISQWEYFAILSLMETKNFYFNVKDVAMRFSLSEEKVKTIVQDLVKAGFIKRDLNQGYVRKIPHIKVTKETESQSLKDSHKDILNLAIRKLDTTKIDQRYYSSLTIPFHPEKIGSIRKLISDFRTQLKDLYKDCESKSIYNISIQVFPLSLD